MTQLTIQEFSRKYSHLFSFTGFTDKGSAILMLALKNSFKASEFVGFYTDDGRMVHTALFYRGFYVDCHGVSDQSSALKNVSETLNIDVDCLRKINEKDIQDHFHFDLNKIYSLSFLHTLLVGYGVINNIAASVDVADIVIRHVNSEPTHCCASV